MMNELHADLPDRVTAMLGTGSISLQEMLKVIGNNTAARNADIFSVLRSLSAQRSLEVFTEMDGQNDRLLR